MPKMENKHTPGPWKIGIAKNQNNALAVFDSRAEVGNNPKDHRCICIVTEPEMADKEDEANAALIAAAPDLLKALKDCLDFPHEDLEMWATGGGAITITLTPYHIEQAIAAIAKAETV